MLGRVVGRLEAACGIDAKAVRLFCNSRIPEKPLLSAAGLGRYGANGLAIIPGLGSSFVIAGAVLPVPTRVLAGEIPARIPDDPCGPCDLCIRTCPVGAIVERGLVDPDRCLQGIASREGPLRASIMERWGYRFYGCQECQNVCPHNRGLAETGRVADGEIGPSVSLRKILALDPEGVESLFRGTTMGMSWISGAALLRNALVAAGNRKDPALSPLIAHHVSSGEAGIRDAAEWALGRI
jgi:epoxyqueuosine reductase